MGAFIVAAIVFFLTLGLSAVVFFGDAMSDETGTHGTSAGWWLMAGTGLAAVIAGSHWIAW
jgi:hypothetical protein